MDIDLKQEKREEMAREAAEAAIEEEFYARDFYEKQICLSCSGSGEGYTDGSKCQACNGKGEI
jgi:DnaJ-class molecular chaperone